MPNPQAFHPARHKSAGSHPTLPREGSALSSPKWQIIEGQGPGLKLFCHGQTLNSLLNLRPTKMCPHSTETSPKRPCLQHQKQQSAHLDAHRVFRKYRVHPGLTCTWCPFTCSEGGKHGARTQCCSSLRQPRSSPLAADTFPPQFELQNSPA